MHHDRHCHHHHHCHHEGREHEHEGCGHHGQERQGCPSCGSYRCPRCGRDEGRGREGQGGGHGFEEKRLVDTIVRLVTENVSREIERIVYDAMEKLRSKLPPPPPPPPPHGCPECGK